MVPFLETVTLTTAADGSSTAYSNAVKGRLLAIRYVKPAAGGFDNASTMTVTLETTGQAVWAESNVDASASRYPRVATHGITGVAALYAAAGTAVNDYIAIANERIKIVIASGGNAKNATFYFVLG